MLICFGVYNKSAEYAIWISVSAGSGSSGSSSVFSGVFIAEEEKGSGDTPMVDVQALLEAYLNMFLRYASFFDEVSFW
jgi:hypothetical protein